MALPDLYEPTHITAEEVNCLIYAYLQDSGFKHTAFVLRAEGQLDRTPLSKTHIPRGELVELLSKALLYTEVEAHWRGTTVTTNCKASFSILSRHVCSTDPSLPASFSIETPVVPPEPTLSLSTPNSSGAEKRKADTQTAESTRKEKRLRTEDMMDLDSAASSPPLTKASTPLPSESSQSLSKKAPTAQTKNRSTVVPEKLPINFLEGHKTEVFLCSWNPVDATLLASGSKDTVLNIWNVTENLASTGASDPPFQLAYLPKSDQGDLTSLDWNADGSLLAAGSYDAILRICDASGNLYYSHEQHKGAIFSIRFSRSGKLLLTASLDGSVCVWDVPAKQLYKQYSCHKDGCLDIDWITEDLFTSCGTDAQIHAWKLDSTTPVRTFTGHLKDVNQIKCNPNRTLLASCSDDSTARIWNIADMWTSEPPNQLAKVLVGHEEAVISILWCPSTEEGSSEILATSSFDQTCRLWNTVTGDCLHIFSDQRGPIFALAFSPDARFIATGSGDGWLHVYDVKTRERLWSWHTGNERPAIFEISWQQIGAVNRMALALESTKIGIVDVSQIGTLQ